MSFDELWAAAPVPAAQPQQNPFAFAPAQPAPAQPAAARPQAAALNTNPFADMDAYAAPQPAPQPAPAPAAAAGHANVHVQLQAAYAAAAAKNPTADPFQLFASIAQSVMPYAAQQPGAPAAVPAPAAALFAAPQPQPKATASDLGADMLAALNGLNVTAPAAASSAAQPVGGAAAARGKGTAQPQVPAAAPTALNIAFADDPFAATGGASFDELFASAANKPVSTPLARTSAGAVGGAAPNSTPKPRTATAAKSSVPKSPPAVLNTADDEGSGCVAAAVASPRSRKAGGAAPASLASPKSPNALDLSSFKALAAASPKAPSSESLAPKAGSSGSAQKKGGAAAERKGGAPAIQAFTTRRIQKLHNTGFEYVISPMGSELENDEVVNDSGSQSFARNIEKVFCRADIWEAPNDQFDVKGEWFADGHAVNVPGTLTEQTAEGQLLGFVQFTFPRGTNFKLRNRWITFNAPIHQWPPGNYHLKIAFGTLHTERVDFSIRPDSN